MTFAIKAKVTDLLTETFVFSAQKTMYGGKRVAKGDAIFVFASERTYSKRGDAASWRREAGPEAGVGLRMLYLP